ncbi:hypothetical protein [Actinomyces israelii]|uniref:hypothetical protein n=1 Tax=Actinomyces israelii TaxID=1659 RepID=UPI002555C62A|nr:hypothetical protein [Actinomyces israelii]
MSEMRLDWGSVRTRDGVKPDAAVLDVFVTSEDIDTVYDAYCRIEHAAFYNRDLEEAALPLTSALIEMVCSGRCTHWGLTMATDALYEISLGQTMREEETDGTSLADRCREVIRDNLPRLYQAAGSITDDDTLASFVSITGMTDPDENRWNTFTQKLLDHNPEVLTADEVKNTRAWRTRIGGPLYEGFDWWK